MKKKILIGMLVLIAIGLSGIGMNYLHELVSFFHKPPAEPSIHSIKQNQILSKDSTKLIAFGKLPYLKELPILDNALYFKYYFNELLFGGANISLVKVAARKKNGDFLSYKQNEKNHLIEFDITKEPYIEFFYKDQYYSFSVTEKDYTFKYELKKIHSPTLIFDIENKTTENTNVKNNVKKTKEHENILDWIIRNKDWLFSGIGIFIIASIIQIFIFYIRNNKVDKQIERIAEKYVDIIDGKISGHSGIPGLIECGAAELKRNSHLLKVGIAIKERGKPNPLEHWISNHIQKKEFLNFIKWQAKNNIGYSPHYFNENNFTKLVQRYNESKKHI